MTISESSAESQPPQVTTDALLMLPKPPLTFLTQQQSLSFDLTEIEKELSRMEKQREGGYTSSKQLQFALTKARISMEYNMADKDDADKTSKQKEEKLDELFTQIISDFDTPPSSNEQTTTNTDDPDDILSLYDNTPRVANLGYKMEDFIRYRSFRHFLSTGKLLSLSSLRTNFHQIRIRDDEYLGGACILLSHDLARYAVGRAIVRDTQSVRIARDLVEQLNMQLLKFDFRNGPLRRKYDGIKYALKKLETILYELSVTEKDTNNLPVTDAKEDIMEPASKRAKINSSENDCSLYLDVTELDEIRLRMEKRDEIRETLIKKCRDGQKMSKQAIFALHRGDFSKSSFLLTKVEALIQNDLFPLTRKDPYLRNGGSLGGVLEEYAEAKLFLVWLKSDGEVVLKWEDFPVQIKPEEYLGGLCDLTGEIGRYAVKMGTTRDTDSVKKCLATNMCILHALNTIALTRDVEKKLGALRMSVEKLQHILYELSLVQATGRNMTPDSIKQIGEESIE